MSKPFTETGARRAVLPPTSSIGTTTTGSVPAWRRIAGLPPVIFVALFTVVLVAGITGALPDTMLAGFAVTLLFGGLLAWIGNLVPVVRDFGLPTILCTFAPALVAFAGVMPESFRTVVGNFVDGYGFLDFFVIAIIVGSVLGMPRALLMKAGPRFIVPLVGCLAATFLIVGAVGAVLGFGLLEAILFIAAPIMAGGLGLGAVPMADMYAQRLGGDSADFMGDLMSAVVLANIVCILIGGVYNGMGRRRKQLFVGFNGNGQLLRIEGRRDELTMPPKLDSAAFAALGVGLAIASTLFVLGQVLGAFLPALHPYAWTIIAAVIVKLFGLFPARLEESATAWGDLIGAFLVPALLVGVSLTFIDIEEVLASLANPAFIPLTVITVIVATLTSGALGWAVKMNFLEAAITPGLVMADTGGSGDVAVLSAAGRMHLMPFAALTNRVGGVLVLFVTSLLATLLA
ncbi:2-hydroxycarboxylate transporter family protein [Microbacterium album]|uniref:Citrate:sodium symporter n=1 Tax=Microbacterium album TaxID=2053191 RepID=A0A917MK58_9MICO|nr:2-hydroxycarboxylate transporter family protein [Microbacterium album]GGH33397.1 citrate:sodium symporter [Microbacterium album]